MALPVVVRGAANDLAVQLSTTGYGLPLELSTLPGALPVRIVTVGGVPCLDPVGNVFGGGGVTRGAGTLDWDDDTSDATPDFSYATTDMVENDTARLEWYSDVGLSSLVGFSENPVSAGEQGAQALNFAVGTLDDGVYYFRAKHSAPGGGGTWSNTEVVTIATLAAMPKRSNIIQLRRPSIILPQRRRNIIGQRAGLLLDAGGASAEVSQYLARATGMDATHVNAFTALIDGLVADSLWSKLDALYIFATDTQAHALLNVKSSSYSITANGSPTFTADQGFAGVAGSTTVYLNTNFNPSTAGGVYTQNSAHISAWGNNAIAAENGYPMGATSASNLVYLASRWSDGFTYNGCNITAAGFGLISNLGDAQGHQLVNRSGAGAQESYRNATSLVTNTSASTTPPNLNIHILGRNNAGSPADGSSNQYSAATIGSSLSGAEVTALRNRLATYRTAVGL